MDGMQECVDGKGNVINCLDYYIPTQENIFRTQELKYLFEWRRRFSNTGCQYSFFVVTKKSFLKNHHDQILSLG